MAERQMDQDRHDARERTPAKTRRPAAASVASHVPETSNTPDTATVFTKRQSEVLAIALSLLVTQGEAALTTAGVARAANCSKESLYKWFGDRDGLLAAIVSHQASKVRHRAATPLAGDADSYRRDLAAFAEDLLTVLASDRSLALNRLAISQASRDDFRLGTALLERGRRPVRERAQALIEKGAAAGLVDCPDAALATRTFYGLIVGDSHVSQLLGAPGDPDMTVVAVRAADQFLILFGTKPMS